MRRGSKALAVGTVALLAGVAVLWHEMQGSPAIGAPAPAPLAAAAPAPAPVAAPVAQPAPIAKPVAEAPDKPKKIDPASDKFFYKFTDEVPAVVTSAAAKCYQRRKLDMDAKITVSFVDTIKDGEVTVSSVKIKESSLDDPAMEACIVQAVARSHWHDDELPDTAQDDEVTITPMRGGKKYTEDNLNYVGALAPANTPR